MGTSSGKKEEPIRFRADIVDAAAQGSAKVRRSFAEIEKGSRSFVDAYGTIAWEMADSTAAAAMGASAIERVQAAISFFQIAMGKRIAEFLFGIIQALNRRKLGLAALATRSLLEVTAVVSFTQDRVERRLRAGIATREDSQELSDLLEKSVRSGRFDWELWLSIPSGPPQLLAKYALDPKLARRGDQVSVLTRIEQLDQRMDALHPGTKGGILLAYDLLSDMCHPSVGAHFLYVAPERRLGWYGFDPLPSDDLLRQYCLWTTTPLVENLAKLDAEALNALRGLAEGLNQE